MRDLLRSMMRTPITPRMTRMALGTMLALALLFAASSAAGVPAAHAAPVAAHHTTTPASSIVGLPCSFSSGGTYVDLYGGPNNFSASCSSNANTCSGYGQMICLYANNGLELIVVGHGCVNLTALRAYTNTGTWNDVITGFSSYSGIRGALWWDINDSGYYYLYGPPGSGRVTSTSNMGTWNNQTSSVEIDNPSTGTADPGC